MSCLTLVDGNYPNRAHPSGDAGGEMAGNRGVQPIMIELDFNSSSSFNLDSAHSA